MRAIHLFYCLLFCAILPDAKAQSNNSIPSPDAPAPTNLTQQWELDESKPRATFKVSPYKPLYILLANWTSDRNTRPVSENPDYSADRAIGFNNTELKFQLSFKTKVWQGVFGKYADLWVGYTQTSRWQIYNGYLSRPFRETNYEPELLLVFPLKIPIRGFTWRMLAVGMNHQSNGRPRPTSRSWNRIVFQTGFENKNWIILLRPWLRLTDEDDENPEITNFIGRADGLISYTDNGHVVSLKANHTLRFGNKNRGALQVDWAIPIRKNFRGHFQFFHGYGESMIDYNFKQTTLGIGVSLSEWQ